MKVLLGMLLLNVASSNNPHHGSRYRGGSRSATSGIVRVGQVYKLQLLCDSERARGVEKEISLSIDQRFYSLISVIPPVFSLFYIRVL